MKPELSIVCICGKALKIESENDLQKAFNEVRDHVAEKGKVKSTTELNNEQYLAQQQQRHIRRMPDIERLHW